MKQTDIDYYVDLATAFREALEKVVELRQYGRLTPFAMFPTECCRYGSDLLAEYLIQQGVNRERIRMLEGKTGEGGYTHCWLLIDNFLNVDITADQFNGKPHFEKYEPLPAICVIPGHPSYLYEAFEAETICVLPHVGINSYNGDIPIKLRMIYDAIIRQIK